MQDQRAATHHESVTFVRGGPRGRRVGLLPGAFNPPTVAHAALIDAARAHVDQVVCVLPRAFPHKAYEGASLEQRIEMLAAMGVDVAVSDGGLYVEIAREYHDAFGPEIDVALLCGRDAAERIVGWDYGEPDVVERMLRDFRLLVADRGGRFHPAAEFAERIIRVETPIDVDTVSSSELRRRIGSGERWEDLVPGALAPLVGSIYR